LIPGAIIMSEKATQSKTTIACPTPLVLFGIDSRGKPKAARFGKQHAGLALKAATQLQLQVLAGNDPKIADLAAQLPVGRVHATGRTFVPFIRRDLYDQLLAAAANGNAYPPSSSGSSGASGSAPGGSAPRLPRNWQEIGIGDLVVANQDRWEGWYEAIVTGVDGDMLTLRWRDYPRERRIVRHRFRLGLLYPNATVGKGSPAKTAGQAKHDKPATAHPVANDQSLPQNWDEVDINHVVLAKDDSQWGAWWEAIPVEKAGDSFKLRWREKYAANVPLITRPRLNLALLCPNAA
jgi:hypothetical protein